MSFWWYKRDNNGKRILWQIDCDPMIILVVFGLLVAMVGPPVFSRPSLIFPIVIVVTGLACLTISKISLYNKGIWLSFGPGQMSKGYAMLYKVGYFMLVVGTMLLLALLHGSRRT
jgi:hypothetical protein